MLFSTSQLQSHAQMAVSLLKIMELTTGLEPVTSPLPRECSTTEPRELRGKINNTGKIFVRKKWSVRQGSNLRHPAWKAGTLPTELRTLKPILCEVTYTRPSEKDQVYFQLFPEWWREMDSNHRRCTPTDLQSVAFGHSAISPSKTR